MNNIRNMLQNQLPDIKTLLTESKNILTNEIHELLDNLTVPCPKLKAALTYNLNNQGKCIRSALVYYAGLIFNANSKLLKRAMLAVELIHTYSLIHDDLPAMDNSDLRRGMSTCHIKFDEATAILVADGLQALAFEQLSNLNINPEVQLKMLQILTSNSGINGMVGGQSLDINNQVQNKSDLDKLHSLKTGALIKASILLGAYSNDSAPPNQEQIKIITDYGEDIGRAFQIVDDILDIEQSSENLGKPQNLDAAKGIPTYPQIIGSIAKAKQEANQLIEIAVNNLKELSKFKNINKSKINNLEAIAFYVINRSC